MSLIVLADPPRYGDLAAGMSMMIVTEQSSTGQSYATGNTLPWSSQNRKRTRKPPKKKSR
jgi:hypothetical protein